MSNSEALHALFRYEVDTAAAIGSGGCGQLWKAHDRLYDETVAIKTIRDELGSERAIRSFELEAVAAARLSKLNKSILGVRDLGRIEDSYYLVMEWVEPGPSGRADIAGLAGACSLGRARQILMQICDAVAYAHRRGIVHSDIAPWNILYESKRDTYLLADFGLLKIIERDLLSVPSRSLLIGGRVPFLPPYAHRDLGKVSPATDTYALAVTFWHLLAGDEALRHNDVVPEVIPVAFEQRDAPYQARRLLKRFIEDHTATDTVGEFVAELQSIPVR